MDKIWTLFVNILNGLSKDPKTQLILVLSVGALFLIWTNWRADTDINNAFILRQLKNCEVAHEKCQAERSNDNETWNKKFDSLTTRILYIMIQHEKIKNGISQITR